MKKCFDVNFLSNFRSGVVRRGLRSKPNVSHPVPSQSSLIALLSGGTLAVALKAYAAQYRRVYCEGGRRKPAKTRILDVPAEGVGEDKSEPPFPWREFFRLLKPDVWLLLGAVLVSR